MMKNIFGRRLATIRGFVPWSISNDRVQKCENVPAQCPPVRDWYWLCIQPCYCCPDALKTLSSIASTQPHATGLAVYGFVFPYILPTLIFNVSHFISSLLPYGTMFDVFSRINATNLLSPSVDGLDGPSNLALLALTGFFRCAKTPGSAHLLVCW